MAIMGGPGSGKTAKKRAAAKAPPPQKPQGKDKKRTPQSAFDPAAGKDVYEPELSLFLFHE